MTSSESLPQKVALVTGSSRGLGRAMALKLAADGFAVAVHYGRNQAEAEKVAGEIVALGVRAEVFGADLSTPANAGTLVEDVIAAFGRLDVLVNNAGLTRDGLAIRMKDDDWGPTGGEGEAWGFKHFERWS